MAFQPAPDMAKVAINGELNFNPAVVTMHFLNTGGINSSNLAALCTAVAASWANIAMEWVPSAYTYRSTDATALNFQNDIAVLDVQDTGSQGARFGDVSSGATSKALSWRSGLTGRSARGRMFWPGFQDGDAVANFVSPTVMTGILAWANTMIGLSQVSPGWALCICSRWANKVKRAEAIPFVVTSCKFVNNRVDTQRRRLD